MDRYCPECNSTMTPSLVGYLCSNCGNMHRFYTEAGLMPTNPSPMPVHLSNPAPSQPAVASNNLMVPDNKLQATLKRLMVPELPPPHSHDQSSYGNSTPSSTSASSGAKYCGTSLFASEIPTDAINTPPTPIATNSESSVWIWVALGLIALLVAGFIIYMLYQG